MMIENEPCPFEYKSVWEARGWGGKRAGRGGWIFPPPVPSACGKRAFGSVEVLPAKLKSLLGMEEAMGRRAAPLPVPGFPHPAPLPEGEGMKAFTAIFPGCCPGVIEGLPLELGSLYGIPVNPVWRNHNRTWPGPVRESALPGERGDTPGTDRLDGIQKKARNETSRAFEHPTGSNDQCSIHSFTPTTVPSNFGFLKSPCDVAPVWCEVTAMPT